MQELRSRSPQRTSTTLLSVAQPVVTDLCVENNRGDPESWKEIYDKVQSVHFRPLHFGVRGNTIATIRRVFASIRFFRVRLSSGIKVWERDESGASMAKVVYPIRVFGPTQPQS